RLQGVPLAEIPSLVRSRFRGFQDRGMTEDPLVICGTNVTRSMLNQCARMSLGTKEVVVPGERVVCLRNAYINRMLLANGFRGKVERLGYSANPLQVKADLVFPDESLGLSEGVLSRTQFGV